MTKYICKNCNYRFDTDNPAEECPYCGKKSLGREKSASELLEEIEDVLKD